MQLLENPIVRVFVRILVGVFWVVALGGAGFVGLWLMFLPAPNERIAVTPAYQLPLYPDWTTTTEVYVRNRSADYMQVILTVARPALPADTVWWSLSLSPEAIGQALVLRDSLVAQGLYFPLAEPVLVPGTTDTLIDKNFDNNLPRELVHCKRYNSRPRASVLAKRYIISEYDLVDAPDRSAFGKSVAMYFSVAPPDSLRLVLYLAPDSTLRVARRRVAHFTAQAGLPATTEGCEAACFPPSLLVQHYDTAGHLRLRERPPLARLLGLPAAAATLPRTGCRLVRRYWDCR